MARHRKNQASSFVGTTGRPGVGRAPKKDHADDRCPLLGILGLGIVVGLAVGCLVIALGGGLLLSFLSYCGAGVAAVLATSGICYLRHSR